MDQCRSPTHPAGTSQEPPSKSDDTESKRASEKPFSPALENFLNRSFEWEVNGCSKLVSPDEGSKAEKTYHRRSPSFRFMDRTWYLHLYPNLPSMVVCLMLSGEVSGPPVRLHQHFGLKNANGYVEWKFKAIGNFGSGTQNVWKKKGQSFLNKEELIRRASDLVQNDSITIVCVLSTDECMRFIRDFMCQFPKYNKLELMRDFKDDTLFIIKGIPFYVNLDLIRRHCPLLASHLITGAINQTSYPTILIILLLRYFEFGVVLDIPVDEALKLYELAAIYQIVELRDRCLAYITTCLQPEKVLKIMDFAKKHSEPELLQVATKYLVSHAQQVMATREWMQLVKKDPEQANQFYRRIAGRITVCPQR